MLTVLVKDIHGGESVFQAQHVVAYRKEHSDNLIQVECYNEKAELVIVAGSACIQYGTVFVMNDNGKTVATYYLAQE